MILPMTLPMTGEDSTPVSQHASHDPRFELRLSDRSRVGVIGSGPAGSFFSYFLLDMAGRVGMDIELDIYESRDFSKPGPQGCNMCGGIVSELLVQTLATEGINLPPSVVQRGIDSYLLHTDVGDVRIETPLHEKRIASVFRGSGPRDARAMKWESFDGHLAGLVSEKGGRMVRGRIENVTLVNSKPSVVLKGSEPREYDLLAVAVGVNSSTLALFEKLGLGYHLPETTRTFIREYYLGEETVGSTLGSSMHVFLLDIPRLEFAAIIPKGAYATVCMLGKELDNALVQSFLESPEVKRCMPSTWNAEQSSCQCWPRINIQGAEKPYADRVVFIGDSGVTRLYKDGIGAAYRTAKAAAATAVLHGISAEDFGRHYLPTCKAIGRDNAFGKLTFQVIGKAKKIGFARGAILRMTAKEQTCEQCNPRMSKVLWDMFTGSGAYTEIFLSALHPIFLFRFLWNMALAITTSPNHG